MLQPILPSQNNGETDDLLITPYLQPNRLPSLLRHVLPLAATPEEQDMLLLSSLTAVSACLPKVAFRYGHTGKTYYPNLQTFIMAGSASGKGIAETAKQLVTPLDAKWPLLIPGDSTYPAFFNTLYDQDGEGYMHESEGSVITDIWKSGAMNYNTALRKAAEHETLSRNRVKTGTLSIACPKLSCLLTGTFDQFRAFVPSVQNGFFSRLVLLVVRGRNSFDKSVFLGTAANAADQAIVAQYGQQLLRLYEQLQKRATPISFRLTEQQALQLGECFGQEYAALIGQLGDNFHPSVVRMGVTAVRIAAILTALRHLEDSSEQIASATEWRCSDEDYETAVLISGKLLLHAADAYQQIEGAQQEAIPAPKTSVQKSTFLATLPQEFETGLCISRAAEAGITDRTVYRWIKDWCEEGITQKLDHGRYQKISA